MKSPLTSRLIFARPVTLCIAWLWPVALMCVSCHVPSTRQSSDGADNSGQTAEQGSVEDVNIQLEVDKSRVLQKEADLQISSQNLATQQAQLQRERAEAEDKLKSISQADKASRVKAEAVQASITEQERALRSRQEQLDEARAQLDKDKTVLLARAIKPGATVGGQDSNTVAVREREFALARREALLAAREQQLAVREADSAQSLTEIKALIEGLRAEVSELKNAPPPISQPSVTAQAPAVSRSQLVRAARSIRQKMSAKGMLVEDLPQAMQNFGQLASQARGGLEAQQAQAMCDRVAQSVDATPINHAFVEGKMARINRALSAHNANLDGANQKKIQDLLSEATDAFSDGRYDRANKKINQICALLRGRKHDRREPMAHHTLSLPLRIVVFIMLVASTCISVVWGETLWFAFRAGELPLWAPLLAPATFVAFMIVFFADRWIAVRQGHYPASRAMFQVGFAVLFFTLLLPQHALEAPAQDPISPAHSVNLEPSLILMRHPDEEVRLAACELVHGQISEQVLESVTDIAHNDSVERVRLACAQALARVSVLP